MRNIALTLMYDGTLYHGWQVQKREATVAETLEKALAHIVNHPVKLVGAGRTDAGVHARCNLAVFDTESRIPPEKFAHAVNVRLPEQICVRSSIEMPEDFHPRRCSTVKTYEYRIYNAQFPDPMVRL